MTVKSPFGHLTIEDTFTRYGELIKGLEGASEELGADMVSLASAPRASASPRRRCPCVATSWAS